MPGSHILVAMMPPGQDAESAWGALEPEFDVLCEAAEQVHIMALAGLPDDHPGRLTRKTVGVS